LSQATESSARLEAKIAWRAVPFATLAITFAAWGLSNMDQSLFGYAVPDLMTAFKMGLPAISLILSASFAFGIVVSVAVGVLTDTWGAKLTLPLCLGISALLVGLQAFAKDALIFGCLRVASAGFSAALAPITNALLAGRAPPRLRALLLAVLQCGYPMGWFLASVFVAPIMAHAGWRPAFMVAFAVVPVAALIFFLVPAARPASKADQAAPIKRASPLKAVFGPKYRAVTILSGLAFLLYGGAVGGSAFYMPTFFQTVRGYSAAEAARIVGASYGIGLFGYIAAAVVSDRLLTRRDTAIIWVWLGALALVSTIWLPKTVGADIVMFGLTTFFFYGASAILIIYLLELFPPELRTTASAVSGTACISAGFMTFPVLTVAVVGHVGWQIGLSAVIAPALALSGLMLFALPRRIADNVEGVETSAAPA
jgi:AAHS family benzoate transporter-like MFS transporter